MRVPNQVVQELIDNDGCRRGSMQPINATGIVRLALDLQDARRGIKIGPEGTEALRKQIRFHLVQRRSGVPEDAIVQMMAQWIVGLIENANKPELRAELEK